MLAQGTELGRSRARTCPGSLAHSPGKGKTVMMLRKGEGRESVLSQPHWGCRMESG